MSRQYSRRQTAAAVRASRGITPAKVGTLAQNAVQIKKPIAPPTQQAYDREIRGFLDYLRDLITDPDDGTKVYEDWSNGVANPEDLMQYSESKVHFECDSSLMIDPDGPQLSVKITHGWIYHRAGGSKGRLVSADLPTVTTVENIVQTLWSVTVHGVAELRLNFSGTHTITSQTSSRRTPSWSPPLPMSEVKLMTVSRSYLVSRIQLVAVVLPVRTFYWVR